MLAKHNVVIMLLTYIQVKFLVVLAVRLLFQVVLVVRQVELMFLVLNAQQMKGMFNLELNVVILTMDNIPIIMLVGLVFRLFLDAQLVALTVLLLVVKHVLLATCLMVVEVVRHVGRLLMAVQLVSRKKVLSSVQNVILIMPTTFLETHVASPPVTSIPTMQMIVLPVMW